MEKNSDFFLQNPGDIIQGPNREGLFDSLRLGLTVQFVILSQGLIKIRCDVRVNSITKIPGSVLSKENWKIGFFILLSRNKCVPSCLWEGEYSTSLRNGQMTGRLPIVL